ncbi:Septum formation initiator [Bacteroidales bacterium Barb6]|nr:Septum formation initiator [Bacteroidales bacterium Barb6]
MSRLKAFYNKYLFRANAYQIVAFAFVLLTFTTGDSSLYRRFTYEQKIRSLEKEIEHYQKEIEANRKRLDNLHTDKQSLEHFAREEYLMKKPGEDIFIIRNK